MTLGDRSPARDCAANLRCDGLRSLEAQVIVLVLPECEIEVSGAIVVQCEARAQHSGFNVRGGRVEIECGREFPAVGPA